MPPNWQSRPAIASAFWWIAGDCLGFRRGPGVSKSGKPYAFSSSLRYGADRVLSYDRQLRVMSSFGFALWDVCQSCERPGSSLDQDIAGEVANPIREFCRDHPAIRRIVLSNGAVASQIFCRHFADWFLSGELVAGSDDRSERAFGGLTRRASKARAPAAPAKAGRRKTIAVVCALGVSGAAASYTYEEKREFWEANVYRPGLALFRAGQRETGATPSDLPYDLP
jgi:hypothetical protein